jgi:hypothetical protein
MRIRSMAVLGALAFVARAAAQTAPPAQTAPTGVLFENVLVFDGT